MRFSYFYGITMILLLVVASTSVYVRVIGTTTAISGVSYLAFALSNESTMAQRLEKFEIKAANVTVAARSSEHILQEFPVPTGSRPHDVAPAVDGTIWYTSQASGELGRLDPSTNRTEHIALGQGSAPHGVIVGPDGAPWITDGGLNAIVRVDPQTQEVRVFTLPEDTGYTNLNTATFDKNGTLWFTGQSGIYGRLNPVNGQVEVFDAPRGRGPYGISTAPDGSVYYCSY